MDVYYAVQVKTGKEQAVKQVLSSFVSRELKEQPVNIVVPMQNSWKKTQKGYKKHNNPVLSGYILIKCVKMTDKLYHLAKNTPGVCRVLRDHISPAELQLMLGKLFSTVSVKMQLIERSRRLKGKLRLILTKLIRANKVVKVNFRVQRSSGYNWIFRPLII